MLLPECLSAFRCFLVLFDAFWCFLVLFVRVKSFRKRKINKEFKTALITSFILQLSRIRAFAVTAALSLGRSFIALTFTLVSFCSFTSLAVTSQ